MLAGIAFAFAMLAAAEALENREPGDQGWAALSLLAIFGGLAIVGVGATVFFRAGYQLVFGEAPPEETGWFGP